MSGRRRLGLTLSIIMPIVAAAQAAVAQSGGACDPRLILFPSPYNPDSTMIDTAGCSPTYGERYIRIGY